MCDFVVYKLSVIELSILVFLCKYSLKSDKSDKSDKPNQQTIDLLNKANKQLENLKLLDCLKNGKKCDLPFYGKSVCQAKKSSGDKCTNNAYYFKLVKGDVKLLCGVHCKTDRIPLIKQSIKDKKSDEQQEISEHQKTLVKGDKPGNISLVTILFRKRMPLINGIQNVFPNFKHGNRTDGIGLPELSPKYMGPIDSVLPGKEKLYNPLKKDITALTLEALHQYSKVFPFEYDENKIKESFFKQQIKGYAREDPWRHKYGPTVDKHIEKLKEMGVKINAADNINKPLFSVYYINGKFRKYSYLKSRYFYCTWYTYFVYNNKKSNKAFNRILNLLKSGINISIIGFDVKNTEFNQKDKSIEDKLYEMFLNTKKGNVFGHELVLTSLLFKELGKIKRLPWEIFGMPEDDGVVTY